MTDDTGAPGGLQLQEEVRVLLIGSIVCCCAHTFYPPTVRPQMVSGNAESSGDHHEQQEERPIGELRECDRYHTPCTRHVREAAAQ
eukprot:6845815-Pyramimonas_sp.AAC.2